MGYWFIFALPFITLFFLPFIWRDKELPLWVKAYLTALCLLMPIVMTIASLMIYRGLHPNG